MLQAIETRWPRAELHQCEWHLQHALERLLAKELRSAPGEGLEELRARAEGALAGHSFWRPFVFGGNNSACSRSHAMKF